jgi:murein DD-endopeptidase MepM/ murein hydrolase activator NlpD
VPIGAPGSRPEVDRARLHEAARALEALILKQLVTSSKAFTGGEGPGSGVRADMFADALADAMVKGGGIGLAAQIERSLGGAANANATPNATSISNSNSTATPVSSPLPRPGVEAQGEEAAPASIADALFVDSATPARVTSGFGARTDPFTGREAHHHGVDLAQPEGEAVHAVLAGVVRMAGERGGYGQAIEIDHGDGVTTLYAHASELLVAPGDRVTPGQPIARVGHSGRATGDHLHFEVRVSGRPVDPSRALKIYGRRADDSYVSGS